MKYSDTVIYKIVCNDLEVKEFYVGSTTNFRNRKYQHKSDCNNEGRYHYNLKLYQFIRSNGGWDNWLIVPLFEYTECENKMQKLIMERKYYEELGATLNCQCPSRSKKEYHKTSDTYKEYQKNYAKTDKCKEYQKNYQKTDKYKESRNSDKYKEYQKNYANNSKTINCECGSKLKQKNLNRHKKTKKHQKYLSSLN